MQKSKVSAKYSEENSVFGEVSLILVLIQFFLFWWEGKGGLGGGWSLLTFSTFGMGAYSRWALIRINTVSQSTKYVKRRHIFLNWVLREEGKFTALCSRPPRNVILAFFTLYSCSIGKSDVPKSVMHVQRFLSYWCRHRRDIFNSLLPRNLHYPVW